MLPELLSEDDGETTTDRPERTTVIKAATDELTALWFRYEPGASGPAPHVHHVHSDCFYVLDGELTVELGAEASVFRAPPGTFVLVPPDVTHSFRNEGSATVRFLNFHAPSCGFHDVLRARRDGTAEPDFDQHDPPPDGGRSASRAVVGPGGAASSTVELRETGLAGEPMSGFGIAYWVLDGVLTVRAAGSAYAAERGSFVRVPTDLAHTVEGPARVVSVTA